MPTNSEILCMVIKHRNKTNTSIQNVSQYKFLHLEYHFHCLVPTHHWNLSNLIWPWYGANTVLTGYCGNVVCTCIYMAVHYYFLVTDSLWCFSTYRMNRWKLSLFKFWMQIWTGYTNLNSKPIYQSSVSYWEVNAKCSWYTSI